MLNAVYKDSTMILPNVTTPFVKGAIIANSNAVNLKLIQ